MALIDPDAVVLLHPSSHLLNEYIAQLWNRAENAGDATQQAAITQAVTDAIAARDGSLTIQRTEFASDPLGHLGRHLKWLLSEIVYRSLTDADISTDLDSIAVGAGVGGVDTLTSAAWSIYVGWLEGTAGSYSGDGSNPVDSSTLLGIYANTSYLYVATSTEGPQKTGTTIYVGIEGYNGGAYVTCTGLGSGHSWRGSATGLKAHLTANIGVPLEVYMSATP